MVILAVRVTITGPFVLELAIEFAICKLYADVFAFANSLLIVLFLRGRDIDERYRG
jgi:hypothetical protein